MNTVSASGTAVANFAVTDDNASNTVSDNASDTAFNTISDNSSVDNSEKSPQTGDNSNTIFWSFISVISLVALFTTATVSKKKKQIR